MNTEPHRLGKLDLRVSVADMDLALALRPRLEELASTHAPAVIARVCDAALPADQHLRIDRLDLDLGDVRPDHLEDDLLAALKPALSEAIAKALHDARHAPSGVARLTSNAAMALERFEQYLLTGTADWASGGARFEPAAALRTLIDTQPADLVEMLRRRGPMRYVIERLVLQADPQALRALLALLAPADAAIILALIGDVLRAHRIDPPPPLDALREPALERLLWVTTFEFLLRDAGTQFNRRRFLGFLLAREAARLGIDYASLLQLLSGAVAAARVRRGFRSSLPVVLEELIAETGADETDSPEQAAHGDPVAYAVARARAEDYEALIGEVRRRADDRPRLEALIARMDRLLFAGVLHRLDPAGAAAMLATIDELATLEREAAPPRLSGNIEATLRWLTLHYLLHDAGSQFNRRRFAAYLIEREAARAGIAYRALLQLLHEAVGRVGARIGAQPSLPGVLAALLAELGPDPESDDGQEVPHGTSASDADALVDRLDDAAFARLIRHLAPTDATAILADLAALAALHRASPVVALSDAAFVRLLRRRMLRTLRDGGSRRFDRLAAMRRLIRAIAVETGMSDRAMRRALAAAMRGMRGKPNTTLAKLLAVELAAAPSAHRWGTSAEAVAVEALLRGEHSDDATRHLRRMARDPVRLLALAATLSAEARYALLASLDPHHATRIATQIAVIERLHAAAPLLALDGARFTPLLWALATAYVARTGRTRFDLDALTRGLLEGVARHDGVNSQTIVARTEGGLRRRISSPADDIAYRAIDAAIREMMPRGGDSVAADRARTERYLRGGDLSGGKALPALVTDDPSYVAMLVRSSARATPAMVPILVERLLAWLLPAEVLACLMPDDVEGASVLAERLDRAGPVAWRTALAALARGRKPVVPRGGEKASARFDRLAAIAYRLDHGVAPWWVEKRGSGFDLPAVPTDAEIEWLFAGLPLGVALTRLRRAADLIGAERMRALLARIAPWTMGPDSPVEPLLARLDARERLDALIGAAAAALQGVPIDLDALVQLLPDLPASPPPAAPKGNASPSIARLLAWLDGAPANAAEQVVLARYFAERADAEDRKLAAYLTVAKARVTARARWVTLLPDEGVARLLDLLAPARARDLHDARSVLEAAWRRTAPFGASRPTRADWWAMVLDLAVEAGTDMVGAVERLVARVTERHPGHAAALRGEALRLASEQGRLGVAAALRREAAKAMTVKRQARPVPPSERPRVAEEKTIPDASADTPEPDYPFYIANAGIVLFGQYLPALFERLGVLSKNEEGEPCIAGLEDGSRAVHWLQYLVDGRLAAPEPVLVLNKLLCGLPTGQPVLAAIEDDPAARAICDGLIGAVIANWTSLGKASSAALRETFLQREGRLRHGDEGWDLVVQRKGVDVLVDRIPWSFSMIYHRWMPQPIKVTW